MPLATRLRIVPSFCRLKVAAELPALLAVKRRLVNVPDPGTPTRNVPVNVPLLPFRLMVLLVVLLNSINVPLPPALPLKVALPELINIAVLVPLIVRLADTAAVSFTISVPLLRVMGPPLTVSGLALRLSVPPPSSVQPLVNVMFVPGIVNVFAGLMTKSIGPVPLNVELIVPLPLIEKTTGDGPPTLSALPEKL